MPARHSSSRSSTSVTEARHAPFLRCMITAEHVTEGVLFWLLFPRSLPVPLPDEQLVNMIFQLDLSIPCQVQKQTSTSNKLSDTIGVEVPENTHPR